MLQFLHDFWPHIPITSVVILLIELLAAGHAVLFKPDSRATIGWVGFILLTPLIGAILYWMFGVDRIRRRAKFRRCGETGAEPRERGTYRGGRNNRPDAGSRLSAFPPPIELVGNETERSLLAANRVEPLVNGDEAYPAMLEAIDADKNRSRWRGTFSTTTGLENCLPTHFGGARPFEIRALIEDIGSRYTFPSIPHALRKAGVRPTTFMPTLVQDFSPISTCEAIGKL